MSTSARALVTGSLGVSELASTGVCSMQRRRDGGDANFASPPSPPAGGGPVDDLRGRDRLEEQRVSVPTELVEPVGLQRGVAVLVKAVGAGDQRARLDGKQGREHRGLAIALV